MLTTDSENPANSAETADIVGKARNLFADSPELAEARVEGEALNEILADFDLPAYLQAAILLYPLARQRSGALPDGVAPEVAAVVDGLLQLGRFALPANWQPGEALATPQSEALRKMLLAIVSDARLVLVRIAEQLYRLRGAKAADAVEQQRIAVETREIYAPLASRLGIWQFKWELEDLSFRYLAPVTYRDLAKRLQERRSEREQYIAAAIGELNDLLQRNGIHAEISGRPKHIYSIWRKMQRKNRALEQIFDMRAVRIFVDDVRDCYAALGIVHNRWPYLPGEFDDYIANPKGNNYQSLHTAVIGPGGQTMEVQIRTFDMHRHAELGVAAHWRYKEGSAAAGAFDQKIRFLRQLLDPDNPDSDLLEQIRGDVFEDHVYAVSPKGDVVEMPADSTPLDFAYHVHTQVGHRCRGAKVNGRIVPLTYKVANGDRIEIITGSDPNPSRDWMNPQLGYLASTRSRSKVRNWFRQLDKDQNRRQGRELLERELSRLSVNDMPLQDIAKHMRFQNVDALCVALGAGDTTGAAIASAVQNLRGREHGDTLRTRRASSKRAGGEQVAVSGVGDLLCNFARCCRPVPPEHIIGYITQARGVSIHRQDCRNFLNLNQKSPERVITVDWGEPGDAVYPAELTIRAYDRQGLLRDISSIFADENVSVDKVQTDNDVRLQQVIMDLTLAVPDLPSLSRSIARLEQLPNIAAVQRKQQ